MKRIDGLFSWTSCIWSNGRILRSFRGGRRPRRTDLETRHNSRAVTVHQVARLMQDKPAPKAAITSQFQWDRSLLLEDTG